MRFPLAHPHKTEYIQLNSHACQACWKCIDACPHGVLGKIDLKFHKHALIEHADLCRGCRACIRACPHNAIEAV